MQVGIIGKPSSGKSTFFKAGTLAEVEIASYPFTTIKPNEGISFVSVDCVDKEFNRQCNPREGFCINHKRFIPVQMIDVAGLVRGAYEGKGRGNQFLDNLRQADGFIHVIDVSGGTDENGNQVEPLSHGPSDDIEFMDYELDMWHYQILKKGWDRFIKQIQVENLDIKRAIAKQLSGLKVNEDDVEGCIKKLKLSHKPSEWADKELKDLASELRKLKPMIIAANKLDVEGSLFNLDRLKKRFPDYKIIGCSAEIELALREAAKKRLIEYIPGEPDFKIVGELGEKQEKGLEFVKNYLKRYNKTGIQEILNEIVFNMLDYIVVYPGGVNKLEDKNGNVLPDCFLMKNGSTALDFAYKLHSDFGDNFIKAMDVKNKRPVGKDYILKNKDVVEIMYKK